MKLNMRFSGDFRVSALGLDLEVSQFEGQVEVAVSKGVDGFTNVELIDVADVSDESNGIVADSIIEESTLNVSYINIAHEPNAELFSRLAVLRGRLKVSMAYRVLLVNLRVYCEPTTDDVASNVVVIEEDKEDAEESTPCVSKMDEGADLFAKLAGLRRELSKTQGVPPYIIFHDKTLWDMARSSPEDLVALYKIEGVGKVKLERYGNLFLEAIREYKEEVMLAG